MLILVRRIILKSSAPQRLFSTPAASASPRSVVERHILRPPYNLLYQNFSGDPAVCILKVVQVILMTSKV